MDKCGARSADARPMGGSPVDHKFFHPVAERDRPIPIRNVEPYAVCVVLHRSLLSWQPVGNRRDRSRVACSASLFCSAALLPGMQADQFAVAPILGLCTPRSKCISRDARVPCAFQEGVTFVLAHLPAPRGRDDYRRRYILSYPIGPAPWRVAPRLPPVPICYVTQSNRQLSCCVYVSGNHKAG